MTDTPAHEQTQQTIEQLKSRLERTERQMKHLQLISLPLLAVMTGFALFLHTGLFNPKPTVISVKDVIAETISVKDVIRAKSVFAESFAVQSAKGDIVAQLSDSLAFFDANKKIRLMASVSVSGGPSVSLLDPQQVPRASLSLNDKSDPSLAMYNADKLPRSVFAIDTGGSGHLSLFGTAGGLLDIAAHDGRVRWTPLGGAPVDALPVAK
jgi:hypothetical protein